ncbi:MAG: HAD-IIIA family hydrolase [candidate division Zixibacteria bacterium]|nr:HAD-IIIA family hydrolase [candidate division Zixibacteria bacterium]
MNPIQTETHPTSNVEALAPPDGGQFEAIIFDMGSTLLEFENVPWPILYTYSCAAVHERLRQLGHTPPPYEALWERFQELLQWRRQRLRTEMREYQIGPLLRSAVQFDGIKLRPGELSRICDAYYAPIRRQVTVYSDARETLQTLKEAGYRIGLLSNTPFRVQDHREELQLYGLWEHIDAALFTSTVRYRKPHAQPFHQIAERLGVRLNRSVYVGDRQYEDVLGPQRVGMTPVLVRRPKRKYEPGQTDSAEIEQISELLRLVPQRA